MENFKGHMGGMFLKESLYPAKHQKKEVCVFNLAY